MIDVIMYKPDNELSGVVVNSHQGKGAFGLPHPLCTVGTAIISGIILPVSSTRYYMETHSCICAYKPGLAHGKKTYTMCKPGDLYSNQVMHTQYILVQSINTNVETTEQHI